MSEQIQQLQQEVVLLKSRILDTQDQLQQKTAEANELGGALQNIVAVLELSDGETGVRLDDIVKAVEELVNPKEA